MDYVCVCVCECMREKTRRKIRGATMAQTDRKRLTSVILSAGCIGMATVGRWSCRASRNQSHTARAAHTYVVHVNLTRIGMFPSECIHRHLAGTFTRHILHHRTAILSNHTFQSPSSFNFNQTMRKKRNRSSSCATLSSL